MTHQRILLPFLLIYLIVCINATASTDKKNKASANTYTVTTTVDHDDGVCNSEDCTLREAINNANNHAGKDTITFNIPGLAPYVIKPTTALPIITDSVIIDGTTQSGFSSMPVIEINGSQAPSFTDGLSLTAGNSLIKGLSITEFDRAAICLQSQGNNFIEGNHIGVRSDGLTPLSNRIGLIIDGSPNNLIGGANATARNVISGNKLVGITIFNQGANGNRIQGNYIGIDSSGTKAVSVSVTDFVYYPDGISISQNDNLVGGTGVGEGNVISGNKNIGVRLESGTLGILVQGNFIGTDKTGTAAIGNNTGITIDQAYNSVIGGTVAAARNIISGNIDGIACFYNSHPGVAIQGNYIGTDITGNLPLGNTHWGILLINASDILIGGQSLGASNLIAFNQNDGILISTSQGFSTGNTISSNSIHSNGQLGINLAVFSNNGIEGVTPNDSCDEDTGINELQNYPQLSTALSNGSSINFQGSLNSKPNTSYRLEFFANSVCDASGFGEGQRFIGATTVTTNADCSTEFNLTFPISIGAGQFLSATATAPQGNTSEFSQCLTVLAGSPFDICIQDDSNRDTLQVNLSTGTYQLINCQGQTITGQGFVTRKGATITIQHNASDRRMAATIDTSIGKGTATLQLLSQGRTFTIKDRNILNNSCSCQ